jgi:hypothetical protein
VPDLPREWALDDEVFLFYLNTCVSGPLLFCWYYCTLCCHARCHFLIFILRKRKVFAFHCIEKKRGSVTIFQRGLKKGKQNTSQITGSTTPSPVAPALAHCIAFFFILLTRFVIECLALLKMQPFRCFQIIQGVSNVRVARPLCIGVAVLSLALIHQLKTARLQ